MNQVKPLDIVYWRGLKAQVTFTWQTAQADMAQIILFPQPGASGNTRYHTVWVKDLTDKP